MEASIKTFCWAICLGAGFRVGWGIIGFIVSMLANAVGHDAGFLR